MGIADSENKGESKTPSKGSFRERVLNAAVDQQAKGQNPPQAPYNQQNQWTEQDSEAAKDQAKKQREYFKEQQKQQSDYDAQRLAQEVEEKEEQQKEREREELERDKEHQLSEGERQIEESRKKKGKKYIDARDKRIDDIETGPHGLTKFLTTGLGAMLLTILFFFDLLINLFQTIVSWLSVGAAELILPAIDVFEVLVNAVVVVVFAIPAIFILGDIVAFFRIAFFFAIDSVLSFIPYVGDLFDAFFEQVVKKRKEDFYPTHVLQNSYDSKKEEKKAKVRHKYDKLIGKANANANEQLEKLKKGIKDSKLAKIKRTGGAGDFFFLLLMLITLFIGPLGTGWISMEFKPITLTVIILYALLVAFIFKSDLLDHQKIYAAIMFLVINFVADLLLTNSQIVSSLFGTYTFMMYIVLGIAVILNVLWAYAPDKIVPAAFFFALIIALAFLGPQLVQYANSGALKEDLQENQARLEAEGKNVGFWDQVKLAFKLSAMKGNGTMVEKGKTERTSQYFGINIADITPTRETFYLNQPVSLDIDTDANSYQPIGVMTFCKVDNKLGEVSPRYTEVTDSKSARIRCTFDSLPKGTHVVDVEQTFRYVSSVKVPLKIMTESKQNLLLELAQDEGDQYKPENYIRGSDTAISTSGPVSIRVGNMKRDSQHVLEMPVVVNKEEPNLNRRVNFKFQLDSSGGTQNGEIVQINEATIDLPSGIGLKNCDFMNYQGTIPYEQVDGRWIYTFDEEFRSWDSFDTVSCDLDFKSMPLAEKFGEDEWFYDKVFFTIDYNYQIEQAVTVKVIA